MTIDAIAKNLPLAPAGVSRIPIVWLIGCKAAR
jgi:hypothetical protein